MCVVGIDIDGLGAGCENRSRAALCGGVTVAVAAASLSLAVGGVDFNSFPVGKLVVSGG